MKNVWTNIRTPVLRERAVYAYVFKKNVDGQGTQSIIKNLNLKKSKRFGNQNFIEVNDYTVQTNYFIFILLFFQTANVLCPFEILRRCTEKLYKNPFTLFFHISYFFSMNQRTDFDASSQIYFKHSKNGIELYGV